MEQCVPVLWIVFGLVFVVVDAHAHRVPPLHRGMLTQFTALYALAILFAVLLPLPCLAGKQAGRLGWVPEVLRAYLAAGLLLGLCLWLWMRMHTECPPA